MNNIYGYLQNSRTYFFGVILFLLGGVIFLRFSGDTTSFFFLDFDHSFWLNVFFINYTFLGDGFFAIVLLAFYFFYLQKKTEAKYLFAGLLFCEVVVQLVKNMFSYSSPQLFFESGQYLFFAPQEELVNKGLFPSGHTAIAFTIATVLILQHKNSRGQVFLLMAPILVGYSRIYLAGHFLTDILGGAFIGALSGILCFMIIPVFSATGWRLRLGHKDRQHLLQSKVS